MERWIIRLAAVAIMVGAGDAAASIVTVSTDNDTYITEHSNEGGIYSVHGDSVWLLMIGGAPYRATPLVHFDLSPYAGSTVSSDATFQLYAHAGKHNNVTNTVELHESTAVWDEATTSWANIPSSGPYGSYDTTVLDTQTFTFYPAGGYPIRYISWTVPAAVVQSWIDTPADNHGLVVITQTSYQDLLFDSKEFPDGNPPRLTFEVATIPEPSALLIWAFGLLGLAVYARRRRTK